MGEQESVGRQELIPEVFERFWDYGHEKRTRKANSGGNPVSANQKGGGAFRLFWPLYRYNEDRQGGIPRKAKIHETCFPVGGKERGLTKALGKTFGAGHPVRRKKLLWRWGGERKKPSGFRCVLKSTRGSKNSTDIGGTVQE